MKQHIVRRKDGSVWAKGNVLNGLPAGYWEWFRKDGTKSGSGSFKDGKKIGDWTTYDEQGNPLKVTSFNKKPKAAKKP